MESTTQFLQNTLSGTNGSVFIDNILIGGVQSAKAVIKIELEELTQCAPGIEGYTKVYKIKDLNGEWELKMKRYDSDINSSVLDLIKKSQVPKLKLIFGNDDGSAINGQKEKVCIPDAYISDDLTLIDFERGKNQEVTYKGKFNPATCSYLSKILSNAGYRIQGNTVVSM